MALNPLTRTQSEYVKAMGLWLQLPDLTPNERNLVSHLHESAQKSVEDFNAMRYVAYNSYATLLFSAIGKGRQAGILQSWA